MWRHFDAARDAHDAVSDGDLQRAQGAGAVLAARRTFDATPAGSDSLVEVIKEASLQLSTAPDLYDAALLVAQIGLVCGECHRHYDGPLFLGGGKPPEEGEGVRLDMKRHVWAAARLWEGVTGPSDSAWAAGARGLEDAPLMPEEMTERDETWPRVWELEVLVHGLALRAARTQDPRERSLRYADVLMTCAACHRLTREPPRGPGDGPPEG